MFIIKIMQRATESSEIFIFFYVNAMLTLSKRRNEFRGMLGNPWHDSEIQQVPGSWL